MPKVCYVFESDTCWMLRSFPSHVASEITPFFFFSSCFPLPLSNHQPAQQSRTLNQRTGCSSTTRTSALRAWLSEAPSPRTWRRGRPDEGSARPWCSGEPNTDIYGHRVRAPHSRWWGPLVLKETPTASQYKFNPHHKLFRSAQPPPPPPPWEPPQARKRRQERSYRITSSRLYRIHVLSLAIALRPAHSLTRTLNVTRACLAADRLCGGFSFSNSCIEANWRSRRKSPTRFTTISRHISFDAFLTSHLMQPNWVTKETEVPQNTGAYCKGTLCINASIWAHFLLYSEALSLFLAIFNSQKVKVRPTS